MMDAIVVVEKSILVWLKSFIRTSALNHEREKTLFLGD